MAELTYSIQFKGIELPIYHINEGDEALEDLGIKKPIDECQIKPMTFYNIEAIGPYTEDNKEMNCVLCNGMDFICPWTYSKLKMAVEGQK